MIDFVADLEDDIQHMYCIYKSGRIMSMEDFYSSHGAFNKKGNKFEKDVDRLIANR